MPFDIPAELGQFSTSGLEELRTKAQGEYDALLASVTEDTVTDEQLDRLEALKAFAGTAVDAELATRTERSGRFSTLTAEPEVTTVELTEPGNPEPPAPAPTPGAPDPGSVTNFSAPPRVGQVAAVSPQAQDQVPVRQDVFAKIIASADVPGYAAGAELTTMLDVAKAFEARTHSYSGLGRTSAPVSNGVAVIKRDYPAEFSVNGDESDYAKLLEVASESRLPGGNLLRSVEAKQKAAVAAGRDSLVAAAGWCAPSETIYDVCLQITTDGMADFPEVVASRGGIRHNTGIQFDAIFGDGTGHFNLTEAQVAAGSPTKTCLEIDCPSFVDTRLGVTGLCLTGNILATRGYPEYTAAFVRGSLAANAHLVNQQQIATVVTGSTAVTLAATDPWVSDGSVISQVFSAVDMAITDIKYRLRLQQSATLEVMLPFWILAQMRADWIRRNGPSDPDLADSKIMSMFRNRGARVQFVYDWQDAFAGAGTGLGQDTALTLLPTSLVFLVYPAGTWVRAVNDVITLNSVYDSTKLATNQNTHLFTETGWAMVQMCPVSRAYTVPICPTGSTGVQRAVDCVTA